MNAAPGVARWIADLEARHLRDLTSTEVARALRALSSTYVERRSRLTTRGAFDTAGKRAAYALYYGPRRFHLLRAILGDLSASTSLHTVHDLGCGTGAAAVAWATVGDASPAVVALDQHPWAVEETRATLSAFALRGDVRRGGLGDVLDAPSRRSRRAAPDRGDGIALSYVVNELDDATRRLVLPWLLAAARRGAQVLVVEPLSRAVTPWWPAWATAFLAEGGRVDEWKRSTPLPAVTLALGRAAGLDATSTSARTLWLSSRVTGRHSPVDC